MTILITGAAGFIGYHTALSYLHQGHDVVGIDNLNDYYDVKLKQDRLKKLTKNAKFKFQKIDIADRNAVENVFQTNKSITYVIHLAAQAGVRYSLENPQAYIDSNIIGHFNMLETAKNHDGLEHFVYASSSSVYGNCSETPFSTCQKTDEPVSLYAATKKSCELLSHSYSHLYQIPQTGLRFFTVYGPFGRPDMAYFSFTKAVLEGSPVRIFNYGNMSRDFTYIDDIVKGIKTAVKNKPRFMDVPHRVYNLGNNSPVQLLNFLIEIEKAVGKKAEIKMEPMQPGDVQMTYADIGDSIRELGYYPSTKISDGIPKFVDWFRKYYNM